MKIVNIAVFITLLFLALIIVFYVDKKLEETNLYTVGERFAICIFLFLNIACTALGVYMPTDK